MEIVQPKMLYKLMMDEIGQQHLHPELGVWFRRRLLEIDSTYCVHCQVELVTTYNEYANDEIVLHHHCENCGMRERFRLHVTHFGKFGLHRGNHFMCGTMIDSDEEFARTFRSVTEAEIESTKIFHMEVK